MASDSNLQRRQVLFAGRVQGVGFRATARDIARRFAVTGYVRNLPDGAVELVAEGEREEIDRFLSALSAEMDRYISSQQSHDSAARGEFHAFEIRC